MRTSSDSGASTCGMPALIVGLRKWLVGLSLFFTAIVRSLCHGSDQQQSGGLSKKKRTHQSSTWPEGRGDELPENWVTGNVADVGK